MFVPKIDKLIGMEVFLTNTIGIGGCIRESEDDFIVEENLVDGSKARVTGANEQQVIGTNKKKQKYLLCVLVKRNWDTLLAMRKIAKHLGIYQTQIQFGGIKDAKAITAQYITIENSSFEDVLGVSIKDIEINPIGYFRDKMSLYYLLGNSFKIRIAAIHQTRSTIEKRVNRTVRELEAQGGVPNFFGHQRFGTKRSITHLVGKAIVKREFEEAAMLYLANPSPYEHPESRRAREELEEKQDFRRALQNFPRQLHYERLMLSYLAEKSDDFQGAFKRLPMKLRQLFVQAFQSYLFNRFLSQRIKNGFLLNRIELGDFVSNIERTGLVMTRKSKTIDADNSAEINRFIEKGRIRIAIPLVGFKQKLSEGRMGEIEKQVLEEEGIDGREFKIASFPEINGRGGLRAIVTPLKNWLVNRISPSPNNLVHYEVELDFSLLRGSYATVFLREIMKPTNPIEARF